MSKNTGVISMGVKASIIRQGDDLKNIVINSVMNALQENGMKIQDGDVIGITESVVARAQGNYVTIDDIVQFLNEMHITKNLVLYSPIMSRNRFSIILKAFARYADSIKIVLEGDYDEQGNPNFGINQFTGVDIQKYYTELCESENCKIEIINNRNIDKMAVVTKNGEHYRTYIKYFFNFNTKKWYGLDANETFIDCRCHPEEADQLTLKDIMCATVTREDGSVSGFNSEYGLLGSNKATDEKLKLFPRKIEAQALVDSIQEYYKNVYGKDVHVLVFGDGCFCSPKIPGVEGSQIYEFADPVTCPAFSREIDGLKPNEIKIKNLADDKYRNLNGKELEEAINKEIEENKGKNLVGCMSSQGTTPRRVTDLLASLFDLCVGSGSRCCPFVLCKNYFL